MGSQGDGTRGRLVEVEEQPADFLIGAAIQSLGTLLLAVVLVYLFRATRYREPKLPRVAFVLAIAGPALVAGVTIASQIAVLDVARDFVESGARTEERADDLVREGSLRVIAGVGFGANVALGFAVILIALYAMRTGLLSRFMGILGIIIGVLFVLPIGAGPILLLFWLAGLGLLFLDRWPTGRGPAWEAARAIPWPSAAEQRLARERTAGHDAEGAPEPAVAADPDTPRQAASTPRRRKRKRRGR